MCFVSLFTFLSPFHYSIIFMNETCRISIIWFLFYSSFLHLTDASFAKKNPKTNPLLSGKLSFFSPCFIICSQTRSLFDDEALWCSWKSCQLLQIPTREKCFSIAVLRGISGQQTNMPARTTCSSLSWFTATYAMKWLGSSCPAMRHHLACLQPKEWCTLAAAKAHVCSWNQSTRRQTHHDDTGA